MDIPFDNEFMINSEKIGYAKNILNGKSKPESSYELKKASQGFEAVLLNMTIQAMWKTIPESGLFEKNSATNIYEGITLTALSEGIARDGGLGIAKMLYQEISKE